MQSFRHGLATVSALATITANCRKFRPDRPPVFAQVSAGYFPSRLLLDCHAQFCVELLSGATCLAEIANTGVASFRKIQLFSTRHAVEVGE